MPLVFLRKPRQRSGGACDIPDLYPARLSTGNTVLLKGGVPQRQRHTLRGRLIVLIISKEQNFFFNSLSVLSRKNPQLRIISSNFYRDFNTMMMPPRQLQKHNLMQNGDTDESIPCHNIKIKMKYAPAGT